MKNKQVISSKKMTGEIIGLFFVFLMIFNISFSLLSKVVPISSALIRLFISVIAEVVCVYYAWKCCLHLEFKKKTIARDAVNSLLKNLMTSVIILCILITAFEIEQIKTQIQKINSEMTSTEIVSLDKLVELFGDSGEKTEYNLQKELVLKESKNNLYVYYIFGLTCLWITHIYVFNLQKKAITDYVINSEIDN